MYRLLIILFFSSAGWSQSTLDFPNVIEMKNSPTSSNTKGLNAFFDLGSWMGFSLSENKNSTGFSGPYLLGVDHGLWAADNLISLDLIDKKGNSILKELKSSKQTYLPERLENEQHFNSITVNSTLLINSKESAVISTTVSNNDTKSLLFNPEWKGALFKEIGHFVNNKNFLSVALDKKQQLYIYPVTCDKFNINSDSISYVTKLKKTKLKPGESITYNIVIQYHPDQTNIQSLRNEQDVSLALNNNQSRWNSYLEMIDKKDLSQNEKLVLAKSICTLINNWRSAAGELKHDGVFPSYHYKWFQGFWAWDSWKHAVALVKIEPELAKNQIRAMYDYQNKEGMIVDCIFRDTTVEKHNWRDTKPPLSSWAIWEVYEATGDTSFIKELYPKLVKYHNWWYTHRDYDKDGLCEYGSADGSLIAAKWESGMDNAIRFDKCQIVEGSNYSINTESVDLNAYLVIEKAYLSKMAAVLNLAKETKWQQESDELSDRIKTLFYDQKSGYYFDIDAETGQFLNDALGPEGWTPLWSEIATQSQAQEIVKHLMDTSSFNTKVPLPTISVSHPSFDPLDGYWRGPVWLDQVWFGIDGLKKYGYLQEAKLLLNKVIINCEGLDKPGISIRENYHPLTGKGLNAEHFSWSAAHLILLITK